MSRLRRFVSMTLGVAGTSLIFAAPAYADLGGGPSSGVVALVVLVLAGIGVAIIGVLCWFVLRGLANRRREREADARRAQHRALEAEKRRLDGVGEAPLTQRKVLEREDPEWGADR